MVKNEDLKLIAGSLVTVPQAWYKQKTNTKQFIWTFGKI